MRLARSFTLASVAAWLAGLALAAAAAGLGTFGSGTSYPVGSPSSYSDAVAIGDISGDGNADVVAPTGGDGEVWAYAGDGQGGLSPLYPGLSPPDAQYPEGAAIGQFNGALKDFAIADAGSNEVNIFLDSHGGLHGAGPFPAGQGAWIVRTADLNGDGNLDLIIGDYGNLSTDAVSVLLGRGHRAGLFRKTRTYPEATPNSRVYGLAVGRINGDHRPDVVTIDGKGALTVRLGRERGKLGPAHVDRLHFPVTGTGGLALADFNGDGKLDLAAPLRGANEVAIMLGDGRGGFRLARLLPVAGQPEGIQAADLNRDGNEDLVVGRFASPYGFAELLGKGTGNFKAPRDVPGSKPVDSVAVGNLNGDRGPDVVLGTDQASIEAFVNQP